MVTATRFPSSARSHLRAPSSVAVAALLAALFAAPGNAQTTSALEIGTGAAHVYGISADGRVIVGFARNEQWEVGAFRMVDGRVEWLPGVEGHRGGAAMAASEDGAVVMGSVSSPDHRTQATRWTESEGTVLLGALTGGGWAEPRGISADGRVIVGVSDSADGMRAFRWEAGVMTDLGVLPGQGDSAANSVSADGSVVVGQSGNAAFRWTAATGMQDLGRLDPGRFANARGVSADGATVIGVAGSAQGNFPFRWTEAEGMQAMTRFPGAPSAEALAISGDGRVVTGRSFDRRQSLHGVFWVEGGAPQPVPMLPNASMCTAVAVNGEGTRLVGNCNMPASMTLPFLLELP